MSRNVLSRWQFGDPPATVFDKPISEEEFSTHVDPQASDNWHDAHPGHDAYANRCPGCDDPHGEKAAEHWEEMGRWAKGLRESYATGEMGDTPYWRS